MIEYNKKENKFTENGHDIPELTVLQKLLTLEMYQGQILRGTLLSIHDVSKRFTEKQMDDAYDKGYKDASLCC